MDEPGYARPPGGHPGQSELLTGRAVFTDQYLVIPHDVMRDIVAGHLPHWEKSRHWTLARPMSGFFETFSHYVVETGPGGGSDNPEPDPEVESVLFLTHGKCVVELDGRPAKLTPGGYVYIAAGCRWTLRAFGQETSVFHWIRKRYEAVAGLAKPESFVSSEDEAKPEAMPDSDERWSTVRFVDPEDLRHDMHVNLVEFEPGAKIPFLETHVMEHGIYILQGRAAYRLNQDWVEVEAGDFIGLRAFCPQACCAAGPGKFRYLLYKDVNRHAGFGRTDVSG
ncbi:MAG: bifunctional allantoicase/(S)-ureidoglycine aminohydrolase [Rhodobacteraceae bacterium]|nr:bifunctional allantoicase/(S)-ureidoglycine aminohydrolase [Paracoccaceae bacterium]